MNEDRSNEGSLEVVEPDESDPDDPGLARESVEVCWSGDIEKRNSTYGLGRGFAEENMIAVR